VIDVTTRAEQHAEALRAAVSALMRRMRAESAHQKYSWPQLVVLKRLETEGPMTTADLARAERIKPQTMGGMIGDLEADELVARRDDAEDGRRRLVSITRAGSRAIAESRAERQSWLARAIETQLDPDEQRALAGAIEVLRKLSG
jgi:DNA-binding MarR family transcriptional regulator